MMSIAVPSGARAPTDNRMPPWEMLIVYTLRSASQLGRRTSTSERAVMRGALRRSGVWPSLSSWFAMAATVTDDYVTAQSVTTHHAPVTVTGPARIQGDAK